MTIPRLIVLAVLIWAFIYTISYGSWTWKKKNKLGAIMLYIVAIITLCFPVYSLFFRY